MPRRYYDFHSVYYYWHEVSRRGAFMSLGSTAILIFLILQGIIERKNVELGSEFLSPVLIERFQIQPAEAHRFDIEPFHILTSFKLG